MKVTVVGGGNWHLQINRHPPCFLVEEKDERILLDCGYGAIQRLAELKIDLQALTAICITHFQADHLSDLLPLLISRIVSEIEDGKEHKPLNIIAPAGFKKRLQELHRIFCASDLFVLVESTLTIQDVGKCRFGDQYFPFPGIRILPFEVRHLKDEVCLGFKLETVSKSMVYTGDLGGPIDTQPSSLESACRGADLIIIEAGASSPSPHHLTVQEVITWLTILKSKRALLNHIPVQNLEKIERALAERGVAGFISIATDDMQINL